MLGETPPVLPPPAHPFSVEGSRHAVCDPEGNANGRRGSRPGAVRPSVFAKLSPFPDKWAAEGLAGDGAGASGTKPAPYSPAVGGGGVPGSQGPRVPGAVRVPVSLGLGEAGALVTRDRLPRRLCARATPPSPARQPLRASRAPGVSKHKCAGARQFITLLYIPSLFFQLNAGEPCSRVV